MAIVVFDASDTSMLVALKHNKTIYTERIASGLRHAEHLMVAVDKLVQEAEIRKDAIKLVGYTRGPGSFTGLRIASASAKGLAEGLEIPVVSVPTLLSFAAHEPDGFAEPRARLAAIDGRKDRYYVSCFATEECKNLGKLYEGDGNAARMLMRAQAGHVDYRGSCCSMAQSIFRDLDLTLEDLIFELKELKQKQPIKHIELIGPGAEALMPKLQAALPELSFVLLATGTDLSAKALLTLVQDCFENNPHGDEPTQGPCYIRKSQAEEGKK